MSDATRPDANPTAIDCLTAVRRLWDYLDGRLSVVAHDEVEAHLATCEKCPPHFAFADRMKHSLGGRVDAGLSSHDETRLRDRVRGALARFARGNDSEH